jgi:hypothetical protein
MINFIDDALDKADDIVIDDCASLYWIFRHGPEELKKFNAELKSKEKEKEGFYFKGNKYKIYGPATVSELIDFMILKNDKMLPDKIAMNADPRKIMYELTACLDYDAEQAPDKNQKPKYSDKDKLFLMNFRTDNNKNKQSG